MSLSKKLNEREKPVVFILWGRPAQEKIKMIDTTRHVIIKSPHPSPLSAHRGFLAHVRFSSECRSRTFRGNAD